MKALISKRADRDIDRIWEFIARDSVDAANRVDDEIREAIKTLATLPGMGHTRADVSDPRYRFWPVYSYVIAYRVEGNTVRVVRVIHGGRNIRQVLGRQVRGA